MAFIKIWIHVVWGTKNRFPFLTSAIIQTVISHSREKNLNGR